MFLSQNPQQSLSLQWVSIEPEGLYPLSILQISYHGFIEFKYRNTSVAKSVCLVFPDWGSALHFMCVVFIYILLHLVDVIPTPPLPHSHTHTPQTHFMICRPRLKLKHTATPSVYRSNNALCLSCKALSTSWKKEDAMWGNSFFGKHPAYLLKVLLVDMYKYSMQH